MKTGYSSFPYEGTWKRKVYKAGTGTEVFYMKGPGIAIFQTNGL